MKLLLENWRDYIEKGDPGADGAPWFPTGGIKKRKSGLLNILKNTHTQTASSDK